MSKYYYILGRCYGFPECCIDFFLKKEISTIPIPEQFVDTGFIPCESCRIKSSDVLLEDIYSRRLTPNKFPNSIYETTIYTILNASEFTIEEKYFVIDNFLYNIKVRHGRTNNIENEIIKNIFKTIDKLLISQPFN